MKKLYLFIRLNLKILIGFMIGLILGFLHWYYFGCYWGTYPMSSVWWVNCVFGAIFGGFVFSFFDRKEEPQQ